MLARKLFLELALHLLLIAARYRTQAIEAAAERVEATLQTALVLQLALDHVLHPLQAIARDKQRAEPARSDLTPGSQDDVHVVVISVSMLGRKPGSDTSGAGVLTYIERRSVVRVLKQEF